MRRDRDIYSNGRRLGCNTLERVGVRGRITRPPVGLTAKGCAYAVVVGETHYERAMRELAAAQILPERVLFLSGDGVYREIFLR